MRKMAKPKTITMTKAAVMMPARAGGLNPGAMLLNGNETTRNPAAQLASAASGITVRLSADGNVKAVRTTSTRTHPRISGAAVEVPSGCTQMNATSNRNQLGAD